MYRFVQDTRFGRIVLAESHEIAVIAQAVTDYVARRMVERDRALVATEPPPRVEKSQRRRGGRIWIFLLGFALGALALLAAAVLAALQNL